MQSILVLRLDFAGQFHLFAEFRIVRADVVNIVISVD